MCAAMQLHSSSQDIRVMLVQHITVICTVLDNEEMTALYGGHAVSKAHSCTCHSVQQGPCEHLLVYLANLMLENAYLLYGTVTN
jgi:hypothetical protein